MGKVCAKGAPIDRGRPAVVFSDLDGTLLDARTYRFEAALPGLAMLRARAVPLVLCSSKTRGEIDVYRKRLDNRAPFVLENGGGICVPAGLLPFAADADITPCGCQVITLGTPYEDLRRVLRELRRDTGIRVTGFGDLTAAGVAALTGLQLADAELARQREFDEPFVFDEPGEPRAVEFLQAIEARSLHWTRGRFHHLLGDNDKGRAVRVLTELYRRGSPDLVTVGIGNAPNDLPMLEAVDVPVLVQSDDGSYAEGVRVPRLIRADAPGPTGWNRAILGIFAA